MKEVRASGLVGGHNNKTTEENKIKKIGEIGEREENGEEAYQGGGYSY